jgi:hypothetical protein
VFQKAAKDVGREDLSAHDLRRFAGTTNARVGATMAENMRRLGHKTFKAAMLYQQAYDDSGKKLAADLSERALAELGDNLAAVPRLKYRPNPIERMEDVDRLAPGKILGDAAMDREGG